jgi:hypothetical protein
VPHECDGLAVFSENEVPVAGFEANVDIFFFTLLPPQVGQTTSSILLTLKTSSSKDSSQSVQMNSKIGIVTPIQNFYYRDFLHDSNVFSMLYMQKSYSRLGNTRTCHTINIA